MNTRFNLGTRGGAQFRIVAQKGGFVLLEVSDVSEGAGVTLEPGEARGLALALNLAAIEAEGKEREVQL